MEATVELKSESCNDFLRCLSNFVGVCNDIEIRGGFIRQRSDDNTAIFELDLNALITDVDVLIANIKQKIELLKTFQGHDVTLDITDSYYKFSDQYSSLKILNPHSEFMENEYISTQSLESITSLSDEDLVFSIELPSVVTERIKIVTQTFDVFSIQVAFDDGETASINAATASKDQFAKFIDQIELNMILTNCSSNVSTLPFKIDHDTDMEYKMYKEPNQNVSLSKLSTTLGDVDVIVYSRASIVEN